MADRPQATPEQCLHFWMGAQDVIAAIVAEADTYLPEPDHEEVLDEKAVGELFDVLQQARATVDMAAGAYARALRQVAGNGENQAGRRQQAPYQAQTHVGITPGRSW